MNAPHANHPTPADLAAFAVGRMEDADASAVAAHLEACPSCRHVAESAPGDSFVARVKDARPCDPRHGGTPRPGDTAPDLSGPALALPPELANHPRYRILRELGRGGMGVVYQARQTVMDRQVAIKVISKALLDQPGAQERFQREVRAAAQLSHPNIVIAHDAERAGDLHMLVMEFVPGRSLADVLRSDGPLPVAQACRYVRQAALGLQHAHERGMVHRDIKPQNLMLTPHGQVKVLDFGLAKAVSERGALQGLTAANAYMGTPEYSAPEQATDARAADIRADVYSLGCTLYCLLAGRPPFHEESAVKTILAHLDREPRPLSELRPDVPAALGQVARQMLAKDPARRYQTPAEVARALAPFCEGGAEAPRQGAGVARRRLLGGAAAAVLVAAAGLWLVAGVLFRVKTPVGTIELEVSEPNAEVFIDGKKIDVRVPGGGAPVRIEADEGRRELKVTRDGFEAYTREITLKAGTAETVKVTLRPLGTAAPPAPAEGFQPLFDGRDLAGWRISGGGTGGWRVERGQLVAEGDPGALYTEAGDLEDFDLLAEVQVGDGSGGRLCFRCPFPPHAPLSYYALLNANSVEPQRTGGLYNLAPRYTAPHRPGEWFTLEVIAHGDRIILKVNGQVTTDIRDWRFHNGHIALTLDHAGTGLRFRRIDLKRLPPAELPPLERLALAEAGTLKEHAAGVLCCAYDPSGKRLATADEDSRVCVWDVAGGRLLHSFDAHAGAVLAAAYSPDGKRLALGCQGAARPVALLYEDDAGTGRRELGPFPAGVAGLAFRPDGRALVIGAENGTVSLHPLAAGGEPVTRRLGSPVESLACSPDGRLLVVGGPGNPPLRLLDPDTLAERATLHPFGAGLLHLAFTPDSRHVLASQADGWFSLVDPDAPQAQCRVPVALGGGSVCVACSADGRHLATADSTGEVRLLEAATLRQVAQRRGHEGRARCVAFRPDGKQLASVGQDRLVRLWDLVPVEGPRPGADGFTPLFNGKDLAGWQTYGTGSQDWSVSDGVLTGRGKATALYCDRGDLTDFHLRLQAQVNDGGLGSVWFRGPFFPETEWGQMYNVPLNVSAAWGQRTGSIADIAVVGEARHGPDEWFTLEVIARGDHLVTRVNGKTAAEVRDGRFQKGRIALVGSQPGTVLRFRRIELKEPAPEQP